MDHSSIIRGIGVSVYLVMLAVLLFVFLVREGVPRRAALEVVEFSVGIFGLALLITYEVANRVDPLNGGDSLLIYLPPVLPVVAFVLWLLRRRKKMRKDAA